MTFGISRLRRTWLAVAAFGIAAAALVPAATVQVDAEETGRVALTEQTLRAFAVATIALMDVREDTRARLAQAETPEDRARIREEAERALLRAVERTPEISVPAYNAISQAARTDPAIAAVVDAAILAEAD